MKFSSPLVTLLSAAGLSMAQAQSVEPKAPTLSFLYSMNCTVDQAVNIGASPLYNRTAYPITGGTFTGPRLNGTIANLGADWGVNDRHGIWHPDTRYQLTTHDGAGIYIRTEGPTQPDELIHLRIMFETGHPDYYWLNYVVAVGILGGPDDADYVLIDAWQLNSPPK
ncbi:hypothetical protein PG990_008642 [Apiospora arundinis]